ncbi:MAG: hypothetical protein ACRC1U_00410, partial [Vibrionaceae bacterium]
MQPPNPTQTAAASLASLAENDETPLNGTVRNSQEQPQTNHVAQSQSSHSVEEGAAAAEDSVHDRIYEILFGNVTTSSSSQRATASRPAFQRTHREAVSAAQSTRWVARGTLTASQRVVSQLGLLLENNNTLTTSDPSKRHTLFSHLHAAISGNLTDIPRTTNELRDFLQPPSSGL